MDIKISMYPMRIIFSQLIICFLPTTKSQLSNVTQQLKQMIVEPNALKISDKTM